MVIHLVHGQTLFNVRRKIARRTSKRPVTVVILAVPVQIPFVGGSKIAHITFYHWHRVIFDVFGEARSDVGDVRAFGTTETIKMNFNSVPLNVSANRNAIITQIHYFYF